MLKYKCPNCKAEIEKDNKHKLVYCGYGYEMLIQVKGGLKKCNIKKF